jgi:predicted enzyme related to lactoylglutathione lyase
MANPNNGKFTWHELMSTDAAKAASFYEALLGWKTQAMPMGPAGTYRIFTLGDKQVGGCMEAQPGQPNAWLVYVGWDDPDAAVNRVVEHGGKVLVPPTEVPNMVRFAIAMDPQGAAFGILKGLGPDADKPMPDNRSEPGHFCWDELYTKDQTASGTFYGKIFGWTGKVGEGDPMKYWHWMNEGKDIGGMLDLPSPHVPPHWLPYVGVTDVDASTAKARELGGKVILDPMQIEKVGKFSIVADPTGAMLSLFRSARM